MYDASYTTPVAVINFSSFHEYPNPPVDEMPRCGVMFFELMGTSTLSSPPRRSRICFVGKVWAATQGSVLDNEDVGSCGQYATHFQVPLAALLCSSIHRSCNTAMRYDALGMMKDSISK